MTILAVDGLQVRYGGYEVLHDVSFDVERGAFLAVVGPNGSGKTTLVKAVVGLIEPASGSVSFRKVPDGSGGERKATVGYLPQKASVSDPKFPALVREVVASGVLARKPHPKRMDARDDAAVRRVLDLLMIGDLADRRVGRLSGGQQQRVHLARALVSEPDLLVLDEPTGALDPGTRACFYETMEFINKEKGTTIMFVTHDLEAASGYADRLLFIDRRVVYDGPSDGFDPGSAIECYFGTGHSHGAACGHE
ncbi:MAG: metal ABC transporter ATP-binding protein [Spirochaetes bacterium]|nr:metal ABC transporter ATP-binding protein [Spirochaetota bacterium]